MQQTTTNSKQPATNECGEVFDKFDKIPVNTVVPQGVLADKIDKLSSGLVKPETCKKCQNTCEFRCVGDLIYCPKFKRR